MSGQSKNELAVDSGELSDLQLKLNSNTHKLDEVERDNQAYISDYTKALKERAAIINQIIQINPSLLSELSANLFNKTLSAIHSMAHYNDSSLFDPSILFRHSFRIRSNGGSIAIDKRYNKGLSRFSEHQIIFQEFVEPDSVRDVIIVGVNFRPAYQVQKLSLLNSEGFTYSMSYK